MVAGPQNNTENTEATNAHVSSSNKNVAESSEALDYPENDTNNNQEEEEDDDDVEQGGSGDNNQLDDDEIDEDDDDDVNTSIMPNETNADDDGPSNNPVGAAGGGGGGGGDAMKNSQSDEEYNSDGGHNVTSNGPMSGGASPMRQYGGGGMGMGSGSNTNLMEGTGPRGLTLHTNDNMSELSSQAPTQLTRSKSRLDMSAASAAASTAGASSRYQNLSYWKARRMLFYRNGDPFFPGVEYRFKPGRDVSSLETLLDKISPKMDLPRGARYVFSMDGDRKYTLDELEDGASYVLSSLKVFKPASYGKKSGMWYAAPGNQGWGAKSASRNPTVLDADVTATAPNVLKPSAGRVIRIINNLDHNSQCRVLLNLRTSQPFEEVLDDLGQVLKMAGTRRMYTSTGHEVRSFSQLRNEFAEIDTFYLDAGSVAVAPIGSPIRRSRSRNSVATLPSSTVVAREDPTKTPIRQRARSKSRPRVLYAPDSEIARSNGDFTALDIAKEDPTKLNIRGLRRTFYPPIHHPPVDNSAPDKKLQLQWVHGYRGLDSRKNLWVLPSGELLYFVAAVAVLFDRDEHAQRHYTGHTEDIMSMDVHPSRELVASGQRAGSDRKSQAHVRIWSTESLQTLYVFGMGELNIGVTAVAFSQLNGGSYILAADSSPESVLSVWQWQWGHLLGKVATLQEGLSGAAFHPLDDNLIITHGRGHLAFWHRRKDGFFERTDIIKQPSRTHVTSVQFEPDGDVITADTDGFITIYSVDADGAYFIRMEWEAHSKGISCLVMLSEGTLLSGGEKDRKIAAWDSLQNYKRITDTKLPEAAGGVRTIYPQRPGRNDGNIYVGTTRNSIVEGSLQRRFNQVLFGHGRQLWGLAVHPEEEMFATAGFDKHIALWRKNKLLWTTNCGYECLSLAFHPFGSALAVGSTEGHMLVLGAENGATMITLRVCGSPINCMAYNQVGDMIAMGSQNGCIYLFRVSRDGFSYKKMNKIRGTQALQHLDWSIDGCYLQTVTIDFDLLFWDVRSMSPERSPIAMKDVKWLTHNCTAGFLVAGMWNNRYYTNTSAVISTCTRSNAHDILASGDADGYIRLFRYPTISSRSEYNEVKTYSGPIGCVRFIYGDHMLITVGGTDAALMIWDLIEE